MEEIKKSLNFMSEEISKMVKQQATLMGLKGGQCELRTMIEQRDQRIELLEQRVNDLEQYIRAGDITTTGLETKHRSSTLGLQSQKLQVRMHHLKNYRHWRIKFWHF